MEKLLAKSGVFFSMLIAQRCVIISNQKSLLVCAALTDKTFHTRDLVASLKAGWFFSGPHA